MEFLTMVICSWLSSHGFSAGALTRTIAVCTGGGAGFGLGRLLVLRCFNGCSPLHLSLYFIDDMLVHLAVDRCSNCIPELWCAAIPRSKSAKRTREESHPQFVHHLGRHFCAVRDTPQLPFLVNRSQHWFVLSAQSSCRSALPWPHEL